MKYKKIKPRRSKFKTNKILYIFLLFLFIGIGYAALTTSLSINGTTNVATNSWNIHFADLNVNNGSVEANPPTMTASSIVYSAELAQPGDYYEFTVDVKNDGTLPGKVSIVSLTGNSTNYLSTSYAYTNGQAITLGDIINAGKSKKIKVKAWIPSDIDTSLLPTSDTNITLTFNLQYIQSEVDAPPDATDQMIALAANNECMYQYTGAVTDEVGVTKTNAENVYYNRCADKRNIKFAGYCWQMIRTTETGGIKMIYNGDVVDGKCESSRGDHKGIVQSNIGTSQTINSSYLYGSSFTYDTSTNEFTLVDTTTATWSDSTYEDLIGKFTCKSSNNTCTTIYQINGYKSNTQGYASAYTIGDTNYAQIGKSSYNVNYISPAMVGYMFNNVYNSRTKLPGTNIYKYGSTFTYANGTYTLSGTTQDISDWSTGYDTINNTHYTCWNTSGTCNTISYMYYTDSSYAYYFDITEGKNVNDILNEMLWNNDVNRYNSSIKGIVDSWYAQNLSTKTNMLEDTVYCNARNITSLGGWNPDGGSTTTYLQFKNYTSNNDISCANETDQFAVSNNKAKLTYPVALATHEELYTLTNNNSSTYYNILTKTGDYWWGLSPRNFFNDNARVRDVNTDGYVVSYRSAGIAGGVRLVVSLGSGAVISSGTGSAEDPFTIQE